MDVNYDNISDCEEDVAANQILDFGENSDGQEHENPIEYINIVAIQQYKRKLEKETNILEEHYKERVGAREVNYAENCANRKELRFLASKLPKLEHKIDKLAKLNLEYSQLTAEKRTFLKNNTKRVDYKTGLTLLTEDLKHQIELARDLIEKLKNDSARPNEVVKAIGDLCAEYITSSLVDKLKENLNLDSTRKTKETAPAKLKYDKEIKELEETIKRLQEKDEKSSKEFAQLIKKVKELEIENSNLEQNSKQVHNMLEKTRQGMKQSRFNIKNMRILKEEDQNVAMEVLQLKEPVNAHEKEKKRYSYPQFTR